MPHARSQHPNASLIIGTDPSSVELGKDWTPPFPELLVAETSDIYRVTIVLIGEVELEAHVAVLDGKTGRFIDCMPGW